MLISDAIREAASEHEIYFLLTAYVEAARHCDERRTLPGPLRELPLRGIEDLRARTDALRDALSQPLAEGGVDDRAMIREAMTLFGVALARLEALQPRRWPLAVAA